MAERLRLEVPPEAADQRLDAFLAERVAGTSRSALKRLILAGDVRVAGRPARPAARLEPGQTVEVALPPPPAAEVAANPDVPLEVLHADDAIVVVDKPAGRVVHPGAGHADDTLVNALLARFPDMATAFGGPRPGIVHRLDRDTSGVMVVARTPAAAEALMAAFKARAVEKVYLALATGTLSPPEGVIDAPVARDPRRRQRMAVAPGGRASRTAYRVLAYLGGGSAGPEHSWLRLEPFSGRTHQIRVHLRAVGHPIVGDAVYGRRSRHIGRMALHAWRLAFAHPTTGETVRFEAPLAPDIAEAVAQLGLMGDPTALA